MATPEDEEGLLRRPLFAFFERDRETCQHFFVSLVLVSLAAVDGGSGNSPEVELIQVAAAEDVEGIEVEVEKNSSEDYNNAESKFYVEVFPNSPKGIVIHLSDANLDDAVSISLTYFRTLSSTPVPQLLR